MMSGGFMLPFCPFTSWNLCCGGNEDPQIRPVFCPFCPVGIYWPCHKKAIIPFTSNTISFVSVVTGLVYRNHPSLLYCQTVSLLFRCWCPTRNPPIRCCSRCFPTSSIIQWIQITKTVSFCFVSGHSCSGWQQRAWLWNRKPPLLLWNDSTLGNKTSLPQRIIVQVIRWEGGAFPSCVESPATFPCIFNVIKTLCSCFITSPTENDRDHSCEINIIILAWYEPQQVGRVADIKQ